MSRRRHSRKSDAAAIALLMLPFTILFGLLKLPFWFLRERDRYRRRVLAHESLTRRWERRSKGA